MSISFTQALIVGGAGIGGVVGFAYGGQSIRTRTVTGTIGAIAGGLIGYGASLIPGLLNTYFGGAGISSLTALSNSTIADQLAHPQTPNFSTTGANGFGTTLYLDVPTIMVKGAGGQMLGGSTTATDNLQLTITNNGLGMYNQSGTGTVLVKNVDDIGLTAGTYTVYLFDATTGQGKTTTLNYQSAGNVGVVNSIEDQIKLVEQGTANLYADVTGYLSGLI